MAPLGCFLHPFFTRWVQKNPGQRVNKQKIRLGQASKNIFYRKNFVFFSWTNSDFFLKWKMGLLKNIQMEPFRRRICLELFQQILLGTQRLSHRVVFRELRIPAPPARRCVRLAAPAVTRPNVICSMISQKSSLHKLVQGLESCL